MEEHLAFVGLRVGDEGKGGRIVHYIRRAAQFTDAPRYAGAVMSYRWNGGANAGHTVVTDEKTYKLHQIPAGVLIPGVYNLQGAGVYLNPRKEVDEIATLQKQGVAVSPANLSIASNAFVTFDFHTTEDASNLQRAEHTSTGNGIKQTGRDKYNRVGIRFAEFLDPVECARILRETMPREAQGSIDALVASYEHERDVLAQYRVLENDVWKRRGQQFTFGEGANGFDIDVQEGLYPGVTSSTPAQVVRRPNTVVGVVKLYDSSVGHDRPFVSRWADQALEAELRTAWGERGTTTGKDRKLGWLDLVAAKHAVDTIGIDVLIGNCGDRLEAFAQRGMNVGLVTGYTIGEKTYTKWDSSFHRRSTLYNAKPVVEFFEPWDYFAREGKIHPNARRFLDRIQDVLGKEFVLLGTGPGERDVIELKDILKRA